MQKFGLGTWRTEDGRKAVVTSVVGNIMLGTVEGKRPASWSGEDGQGQGYGIDIVGEWIESADARDQQLLEEFAKAALTGLILHNGSGISNADYGRHAFDIADGMLAELKRRRP